MQHERPLLAPTVALSRRLLHAAERDEGSGEREQRRSFSIAGHGFLPQPRLLMEVLSEPRVYPVPNTPAACIGLINLRGSLVPVFDVGPALGRTGERIQWVLVIGSGLATAGLVIDDLPIQVSIPVGEATPELPQSLAALSAHLRGGVRLGDRLFWELDHESLLTALANLQKAQEDST